MSCLEHVPSNLPRVTHTAECELEGAYNVEPKLEHTARRPSQGPGLPAYTVLCCTNTALPCLQLDAMWHPGLGIQPGPHCDAITGVDTLKPFSFGSAMCCVCSSSSGMTLRCAAGACPRSFHVLCARNAGFPMAPAQPGARGGHRVWCHQHADLAGQQGREPAPGGAGVQASKLQLQCPAMPAANLSFLKVSCPGTHCL